MQSSREELIRNRAYELWEQEGHKEGQPEDYWYRAERELGDAGTGNDAGMPEDGAADDEGGAGTAAGRQRPSGRQ